MPPKKHIVFFGTLTNTAGETKSEPNASSATGAPTWSTDKIACNRMDVLFNVKTLTGTSPTITFSVQERFSDVGFVETAKISTISATGKYYLANEGQTGQAGTSVFTYGFAGLGKGIDKQIVSTVGGTVGTVTTDVYFIFYS